MQLAAARLSLVVQLEELLLFTQGRCEETPRRPQAVARAARERSFIAIVNLGGAAAAAPAVAAAAAAEAEAAAAAVAVAVAAQEQVCGSASPSSILSSGASQDRVCVCAFIEQYQTAGSASGR